MRLPAWMKGILLGSILAVLGWAARDRITIGERLSRVEQYIIDSHEQLSQINTKLDILLKEK